VSLLTTRDFTFVCPTEIIAFSDAATKFREIGCEVVGASVDSHFTHLAWTQQDRKVGGLGKIDIPLLSDLDHEISRQYGALLADAGHTLR
jgi:peroxiredoxin (alkyl hydroperoxide reductase subunit C)